MHRFFLAIIVLLQSEVSAPRAARRDSEPRETSREKRKKTR